MEQRRRKPPGRSGRSVAHEHEDRVAETGLKTVTWWESFVAAIADPRWFADFLASVFGAALAFWGAFVLIRIQLRSDRKIADEQLTAAASERKAEHRSVAGAGLGLAFVEATDVYDHFTTDDLLAKLRGREAAPGTSLIRHADAKASLVLDYDQTPLDLWRAMIHTWQLLAVLTKTRGNHPDEEIALADAADSLMREVTMHARRYGIALIRWDGQGAVPSADVLEGWQPVPIRDRDLNAAWRAERAAHFESERLRILKRMKEREQSRNRPTAK